MRVSELEERIGEEIEFPANRATIVDRIGDRVLEAPNGQAETIKQVLERGGERNFTSADDVFQSVVGSLSEAYIGRKRYDDRGHNVNPDHRSF